MVQCVSDSNLFEEGVLGLTRHEDPDTSHEAARLDRHYQMLLTKLLHHDSYR